MDHLWLDKVAQQPPEQVPVLGLVKYDDSDFWTFPERCGYSQDSLKEAAFGTPKPIHGGGEVSKDDQQLGLSVLQEWLFFGLLNETGRILGSSFCREQFIRTWNGSPIASTKMLPTVLEEAIAPLMDASLRCDNPDAVDALAQTFILSDVDMEDPELLKQCFSHLTLLERIDMFSELPSKENTRIGEELEDLARASRRFLERGFSYSDVISSFDESVSICISAFLLAETISEFASKVFSASSELIPPSLDDFWFQRAMSNGRCPSRIFREAKSITEVYLATSMKSNYVEDHSNCVWSDLAECKVSQQFREPPSHHSSCQGDCNVLGVSALGHSKIKRSLSQGSYPICEIEMTEGDSLQVNAQENIRQTREYVAFSHVWSHGLGNPSSNSLPSCQIAFLNRLMRECAPSKALWLDTLCVPLENPYRRQAIAKMRETYSNARMVVVLDKDLLAFKGHNILRLQQVLQPDWMRRLWTYQEAVLASNLYIAFEDSLVHMDRLMRIPANTGPRDIFTFFTGHRAVARAFSSNSTSNKFIHRVLACAETFHRRKTTKKEDEAFCLATLLDVDTLVLPDQPSLVDVFKQLKELPEDILVTPGPRSTIKGFRWSPVSFLSQFPNIYNYATQKSGILTEDGLCVRKTVLSVHGSITLDTNPDELGEYFVLINDYEQPLHILINAVASRVVANDTERVTITDPLIILADDVAGQKSSLAVILSKKKEEGLSVFGHYEAFLGAAPCEEFADNIITRRTTTLRITKPRSMQVYVD